jgi:CRP/FNR family cyclic AMP-dependent transcriptional regulator
MIGRFEGDSGRRALLETLKRNRLVDGDQELAAAIADVGALRAFKADEVLTREGDSDNSVFLIVAGSFSVYIKGNKTRERVPGEVIGETSAIDPSQRRSATLMASVDSVVVELTRDQFVDLADRFTSIWKSLAVDLSRRLVQRNDLISSVNDEVNVFIICSVEALEIAQEIQSGLSHEKMIVTVWTNGVFIASNYPVESLEEALNKSDFAIAIAHPDDQTKVRGKTKKTPRDNVIFELGFFMGRLGRKRTLLVEPRGADITLPSDLKGITSIGYRPGPSDKLPSLLGPVCTEIKKIINTHGPR